LSNERQKNALDSTGLLTSCGYKPANILWHLEKAVAAYPESLAADPTFTEATHRLTRARQDLERTDEAIAVAQRIAEMDPDDVLAHTSLSVL
jgi:tetratricopeptide (TPR) repeat protein